MRAFLVVVFFWLWTQLPFFSVPFSVVWTLLAFMAGVRTWNACTGVMVGLTLLSVATMASFCAGAMVWYALEAL